MVYSLFKFLLVYLQKDQHNCYEWIKNIETFIDYIYWFNYYKFYLLNSKN